MFITDALREEAGQFVAVSDAVMIDRGIERMGQCEICGHKIVYHNGVKAPSGRYMWVGGNCADILTRKDVSIDVVNGAETVIEKIAIGKDMIEEFGSKIFRVEKRYGGGHWRDACIPRSSFHLSLYETALRFGQLSPKQFAHFSKVLAE